MKNSRGITMASLVIVITVIVLLATMAIGFGYRYLVKTKQTNEEVFVEVLSSAVTKRENNFAVSSEEYPRVGYRIKSSDAFKSIVEKYVPRITGNYEMMYERGSWYIVDNNYAGKLGVKGSEDFLDTLGSSDDGKMKLALIDYISGTVLLFDASTSDAGSIISGVEQSGGLEPSDGHVHDYNIPAATCTEDRKCVICGYVIQPALGHLYSDGAATPIDEEFHYRKTCERCGMQGGIERHSGLNEYVWYESGDGTWYHYNGCTVCGWARDDGHRNYQRCTTKYEITSDTIHTLKCQVCLHGEEAPHRLKYNYLDENYHEYVCTDCGYYRSKFEPHRDPNHDNICDDCGGEIILTEEPVLEQVTIQNKEYPTSKYVTNGETIVLTYVSDKAIYDSIVTIAGYGNEKLNYTYSSDRRTCTVELYVSDDVNIEQNTEIAFSINCKSLTTGKWIVDPIVKTSDGSSLTYDSLAPLGEYVYKTEY